MQSIVNMHKEKTNLTDSSIPFCVWDSGSQKWLENVTLKIFIT